MTVDWNEEDLLEKIKTEGRVLLIVGKLTPPSFLTELARSKGFKMLVVDHTDPIPSERVLTGWSGPTGPQGPRGTVDILPKINIKDLASTRPHYPVITKYPNVRRTRYGSYKGKQFAR